MDNSIRIEAATQSDAPFVARAIVEAIGRDHCVEIVGSESGLSDLEDLFKDLAMAEVSQYSYRNTMRAVDAAGNTVGVCISYDGALLRELREPFLRRAHELFGMDTDNVDDETDSTEMYIDTLMVDPRYRGRGVASALLEVAVEKARSIGKPAGLLVAYDNPDARRLYERVGFKAIAPRPFFGIMMQHMQAL